VPLGRIAEGATGSIWSLQARMGDAPGVSQLVEDQPAGPAHHIGDQTPALDLLAAVDARRPGVALPCIDTWVASLMISAPEARWA
jgi:hypothetical protein